MRRDSNMHSKPRINDKNLDQNCIFFNQLRLFSLRIQELLACEVMTSVITSKNFKDERRRLLSFCSPCARRSRALSSDDVPFISSENRSSSLFKTLFQMMFQFRIVSSIYKPDMSLKFTRKIKLKDCAQEIAFALFTMQIKNLVSVMNVHFIK